MMIMKKSLLNQDIKKILFHVFFSVLIIAYFIKSSMISYYISGTFIDFLIVLSVCGLLIKIIFFDRHTMLEYLIISIFLLVSLISAYKSKQPNIFYYSVMIVSAKNIELKRIVANYFFLTAALLIMVTTLSFIGIIPDLQFWRDNKIRHSLGLLYPTVYAAKVFFLATSFFFMKNFKLSLSETIGILVIAYVSYIYTGGRLDFFLLVLTTILLYTLTFLDNKYLKPLSFLSVFSPILSTGIAWVTAKYYNPADTIFYYLNILFSGRLTLGRQAINMYQVKPFGQVIYEQGLGGIEGLNNIVNKYFFIDSSYLAILIKNGWIFYVILICLITYKLFVYYRAKQYKFLIIYGIICVNSLVATFFYAVPVNVLVLFLFAKNSSLKKSYL